MRYSAFLFLLVLSISAFGDTIDLGRGDVEVLVPKNYSVNRPIPLVMLLHGYTSSGAAQDAYFKLSTLVDEYGFIFVAPDGTVEEEGGKNRFWNAGEKNCCNFQGSTVNDSAYLKTLIEKGASIGANATVICGNKIGQFALIGAGAVVTKNVLPHALVVGNPARQIGWVGEYGHRLEFQTNGTALCPESGQEYQLKDNEVRRIKG